MERFSYQNVKKRVQARLFGEWKSVVLPREKKIKETPAFTTRKNQIINLVNSYALNSRFTQGDNPEPTNARSIFIKPQRLTTEGKQLEDAHKRVNPEILITFLTEESGVKIEGLTHKKPDSKSYVIHKKQSDGSGASIHLQVFNDKPAEIKYGIRYSNGVVDLKDKLTKEEEAIFQTFWPKIPLA